MGPHKDSMVFGIYSRKSKWTGKGESIGNQVQLCKDYVRNKYGTVVKDITFKVYEDEGFSGKDTTRPCFQEMLKDMRGRELDCIVCYRLDRISRSVGDFARTIEEFEQYNIGFICIKEQFDTSTPMGKAMMNIAAVFAQLERETIAERIRDNMLLLARTGRWLGGTTPLGFESDKTERIIEDGKTRTSHRLAPVKEEVAVVELIFGKFLEAGSVTAVETLLLQQGARTRNGRDFSAAALKDILSNPVYCVADQEAYGYFAGYGCTMGCEEAMFDGGHGISAYNRTGSEGKYQSRRAMDEWIISVGKHKGMIPSARWIKAQRILYKNRIYHFRYNPKNKTNLLSGLLFCKECGTQMRPRVNSHSEPDGNGFKRFSYLCDLKRKSNRMRCNSANLPGNELDKMVCELLLGYNRIHGGIIHNKITALEAQVSTGNTTQHKQVEVLRGSIAEKENEVRGIIRLLGKDPGNTILYQQMENQVQVLTGEIRQMEDNLSALEQQENADVALDLEMQATMKALETFSGTFQHATALEKRELIHAIVKRVEWDGEKVHIYLFGEQQEQCS